MSGQPKLALISIHNTALQPMSGTIGVSSDHDFYAVETMRRKENESGTDHDFHESGGANIGGTEIWVV